MCPSYRLDSVRSLEGFDWQMCLANRIDTLSKLLNPFSEITTGVMTTLVPGNHETQKLGNVEKHENAVHSLLRNDNELCKNLLHLCYL